MRLFWQREGRVGVVCSQLHGKCCFLVCPLPGLFCFSSTQGHESHQNYLGSLVRETCPVTPSCCSPFLGACGKEGSRGTQKSSEEPPAPAADSSFVNQLWTWIPFSLKVSVLSWVLIRPESCEGIPTAAAGGDAAEWHPGQRAGLRKFGREDLAGAVFTDTVSLCFLLETHLFSLPARNELI